MRKALDILGLLGECEAIACPCTTIQVFDVNLPPEQRIKVDGKQTNKAHKYITENRKREVLKPSENYRKLSERGGARQGFCSQRSAKRARFSDELGWRKKGKEGGLMFGTNVKTKNQVELLDSFIY